MNGQRLALLRIYLDDRERDRQSHPLGVELMHEAFEAGIAGATLFRADSGIGRSGRVRTASDETDLDHLPCVVQLADVAPQIDAFRMAHAQLLAGHLATQETVWFVHRAGEAELPEPVEELPDSDRPRLVRMFCNEDDSAANGESAVVAITRAIAPTAIFHMALTGVEGFGAHRRMHRSRLFHRDRSMPVMISAMCTRKQLDTLVGAAVAAHTDLTITVESVTPVRHPTGTPA